jgi:predicted Zn-ribbon and HTH transcriptional regulator
MISTVPMVCGLCGEVFTTRAFNGRVVKVTRCPKCGSEFTAEASGEELFYD